MLNRRNGAWPSGKATGFGPVIRRFESSRPRGYSNKDGFWIECDSSLNHIFYLYLNWLEFKSHEDVTESICNPGKIEPRSQGFEFKKTGWAFQHMFILFILILMEVRYWEKPYTSYWIFNDACWIAIRKNLYFRSLIPYSLNEGVQLWIRCNLWISKQEEVFGTKRDVN